MLKIGIDTSISHFGRAGVAKFVSELVSALERIGSSPTTFSFHPWFSRKRKWVRWIDTVRYEKLWVPNTLSRLAEDSVDVLHLSTPSIIKCSIPRVINIYDLNPYKYPEQFSAHMAKTARIMIPGAIQNAEAIVTISQYVKQDILSSFPDADPARIYVIPCAVASSFHRTDADLMDGILERYKLHRPYVLCVSTIAPNKNFPRILEAFSQIAGATNCDLAVVGATGWRHQSLEQLPVAKKLGDRLRLLGYVPDKDLSALYSGATVFCYPSLHEGFGIPVLEAMKCGVPVLTSNTTSLPEVAGDAAILVDPLSVDEIAKGLLKLLTDENLRGLMMRRGFEQERKFSWDQSARLLQHVYEKTCDTGGRS